MDLIFGEEGAANKLFDVFETIIDKAPDLILDEMGKALNDMMNIFK